MGTYRSFGPLGLIVVAFGVIAGLFTGDWTSVYVLTHLILGTMMLALYLFTHVDSLKESVGGRQAKYGTNALVYTVLTVAVIAAINYIAAQRSWRWDMTEQGIFSLAPQSVQLLDGLDGEVVARAFYREGEEGATRDLLDSFAATSDLFSYEFIDPDRRPELAEQFEITQYGTVHLSAGDSSSKITEVSEETLTNTLIRLTSARRRLVYFVVGHGEPDPADASPAAGFGLAKGALDNEGFDVVPLVLAEVPDVPADADLVIVAGPERPFLDRELAALDRYIARGGRALLLVDPQSGDDLRPLLAARGVELGDDVIIEQFVQLFAGAQLGVEPVIGDYGFHPITAGFGERTIFQMARSVRGAAELPAGITVDELARTSPESWGETDLQRLFETSEVDLDDSDTPGPLAVGVAVTLRDTALSWTAPLIDTARTDTDADDSSEEAADGATAELAADEGASAIADGAPDDLEGRLVVFGDADWATNTNLGKFYNQDLFLNAVSWLAGEEELIAIRPRQTRASQVMLTTNESQAIFYVTVLLLPELILFLGMMIWLNRRYR